MPGRHQTDVAPLELDRAAEVRVADVLHALPFQPIGQLDDRDAVRPGAPGDRDRVGDVVGVAVGKGDVGRLDLLGRGDRGRVVGLEEGIDEHPRLPLAQLEARMSVESDLHRQRSPSGSRVSVISPCSAQPTATPTIIPILASSASRVLTAAIRSSGSGTVAARSASASCDSPNQPPSASAVASTRCSFGTARATIVSASAKRSASASRSIAASSSSSLYATAPAYSAGRSAEAASPARPPTRPPARPAKTSALDSKIGNARRTTAATATPIVSYSRSIAPRASERRMANQAARAPSAIPLPPAIAATSPRASAIPTAASIPSEPQASSRKAVGAVPRRRSTPGPKMARPSATANR